MPINIDQAMLDREAAKMQPSQSPAAQVQPDDPRRIPRWLAMIGSQMLDAGSTTFAMKHGASEGNPIMRPFADKPAAFYPIKAGIGALQAFLLDRVARKRPSLANGAAIGSTIGTGLIGVKNLVNGYELKGINERKAAKQSK